MILPRVDGTTMGKKNLLLFALIPWLLFTLNNVKAAGLYNIKDLEALESEGQYKEFLDHAFDIRPSERDKHWQAMLSGMAIQYVDEAVKHHEFTARHYQYVEYLMTWQGLKTDEFFESKRNNYALKYFTQCGINSGNKDSKDSEVKNTEDRETCKKEVLKFWSITPHKEKAHEIGVALALQYINELSYEEGQALIQQGIQSNIGEIYCAKVPLFKIILNQMDQLILKEKNDEDLRVAIKMAFSPECRKAFTPLLKEALRSKDSAAFETSFKVLTLLNSISPQEKDLFYSLYILRGPQNGSIFNEAWNTMESLGQNFKRRTNVMGELSKLDPLPDEIFRGGDPKRAQVLLDFLSKNLPEYLEYYANTCMDYLEGKRSFPNGNPTMGCHDFYKMYLNLTYANEALKKRYLNRPKF